VSLSCGVTVGKENMGKFWNKEASAVFMADLLNTYSAVTLDTDVYADSQVKSDTLTEETVIAT